MDYKALLEKYILAVINDDYIVGMRCTWCAGDTKEEHNAIKEMGLRICLEELVPFYRADQIEKMFEEQEL